MSHLNRSQLALSRRVFWIRTLTVIAVLCLVELVSRSGIFFRGVVPSVFVVFRAVLAELADSGFYPDLGITMLESGVGFVFGSIIAIAMGIVLGLSTYARRMIEPYITAIGGTPKIIFLPILFLIFGLGIESKVAKAALSAFFPVVLGTTSGLVQVPVVLLRVGRSFDLSWGQLVGKIYIPAIAIPLLTGLRLGMAMAIIGVLSAEISYSDAGLGFRLVRYADQFRMPSVYAITILIFAVSVLINFVMSKLEDRFNRYKRGEARANMELVPAGTLPDA